MYKSYKVELKLNNKQRTLCIKNAGAARFIYNWGLNQKKQALDSKSKLPTYNQLSRNLTEFKKSNIWLYEVSSVILQQSLKNLDTAFSRFFNKISKFPKFKSKRRGIGSFRFVGKISITSSTIQLPRIGIIKLKQKNYIPLDKKILNVTVSERAGRWFASVLVEQDLPEWQGPKDAYSTVGIDLGINTLATVSDGTTYISP